MLSEQNLGARTLRNATHHRYDGRGICPKLILAAMAPADEASESADQADAPVSSRATRRAEGAQDMPSEAERAPRAESISVLLEVVKQIFDDERVRGTALSTKATSLAGFSGVILSIVVAMRHSSNLSLHRNAQTK